MDHGVVQCYDFGGMSCYLQGLSSSPEWSKVQCSAKRKVTNVFTFNHQHHAIEEKNINDTNYVRIPSKYGHKSFLAILISIIPNCFTQNKRVYCQHSLKFAQNHFSFHFLLLFGLSNTIWHLCWKFPSQNAQ